MTAVTSYQVKEDQVLLHISGPRSRLNSGQIQFLMNEEDRMEGLKLELYNFPAGLCCTKDFWQKRRQGIGHGALVDAGDRPPACSRDKDSYQLGS